MSDFWPPGGQDDVIEGLAERYIDTSYNLDLAGLLSDQILGRTALVSSFGAESAVMLHLVLNAAPDIDVVFLDTKKHFEHTYRYVETLRHELDIRNLIMLEPSGRLISEHDPKGTLWSTSPDTCCTLRKTFPLQDRLVEYDSWLTGRKRSHGGSRAALPYIERDGKHVKINPLILWTEDDIAAYMSEHRLPHHPLRNKGYRSIGCHPCTQPVTGESNARAGRWANTDKVECGIHLGPDGQFVRAKRKS